MQRLQPFQTPHFESKIKSPKNMSKSIPQIIQSCSVQKTARKNNKYSRNETTLKIGHHAKATACAKSPLKVKNYNSKKHVKIRSTNLQGCSVQETARKNTKYSRNETILKIGHRGSANEGRRRHKIELFSNQLLCTTYKGINCPIQTHVIEKLWYEWLKPRC